jgi:uncharacterized protein (UPF0335 family)
MTDAHGVARDQLRPFIERIERLSEEAKTIADDIRDVKSEAKAMGFSVKAINEIIKLRKKDDQERMEEEAILDTYKMALGMISDFGECEPEPERINPRLAKQVVDGMQTEAGRAALIAAVDIMIDREEADEREAEGIASGLPTNQPETATQSTAARKDVPSATAEAGRHLVGNEKCQDKREEASHRQAGNQDLSVDTNSEIAPASHGEAEAPSVESVRPSTYEGSPDANTGGDHVTASENAQPDQDGSGLVSTPRPSKHPILLLRPHCRHPGEEVCGGSGKNHCQKCLAAMREVEIA